MKYVSLLKNVSIIAATAVSTTVAISFQSVASAFTVTQNNNSNDLLNALLGTTTGLSNFSLSVNGDSEAIGFFNDDPFGLGSGVVISTGIVTELPGENTSSVSPSDLNTDLGVSGILDDSTTLEISFDADSSPEKLFSNMCLVQKSLRNLVVALLMIRFH